VGVNNSCMVLLNYFKACVEKGSVQIIINISRLDKRLLNC